MTEERIVQRPRIRAAAIYSLGLIIALYALYKLVSPGFPFSLLLAPAVFGQGILLALLSSTGLGRESDAAYWAAWVGGALVMWYIYYKLVYFLLWVFGIHQPLKMADDDSNAELATDNEGGWLMRVFIVALFPTLLGIAIWQRATGYDGQYSRQHEVVLVAAKVACAENQACHQRLDSHLDECFDAHFIEQGRKWLRTKYVVDREPFRACLFSESDLNEPLNRSRTGR